MNFLKISTSKRSNELLINTTGCQLDSVIPFDDRYPEIAKYYMKQEPLECITDKPPLSSMNDGILHVSCNISHLAHKFKFGHLVWFEIKNVWRSWTPNFPCSFQLKDRRNSLACSVSGRLYAANLDEISQFINYPELHPKTTYGNTEVKISKNIIPNVVVFFM